MADNSSTKTVAIVGGGLVGALNACFFAKRGWYVELFEARDGILDIRKNPHASGRSINLALSTRGLESLKAVDCEDVVLEQGIPMYGRYVHNKDGKTWNIQKYGMYGEHIFSISRKRLNEVLLDRLEGYPKVKFYFEHKMKRYRRKTKELLFEKQDGSEIRIRANLICGCDGAYSAVRKAFMQMPDFNYSQTYIEHKYLELRMDPDESNEFKMPPNYFHIWPRGQFCLIGLPNTDKTFNITLMAPASLFNTLNTDELVDQFFVENFPDARQVIGREPIFDVFRNRKPSHLISIKCEPHHMDESAVLLGDAAHAMVPFYGQGMNCGFEDCLVLHHILEKHKDNIAFALEEYSKIRCIDSHAINDLALYNYSEVRK